MVYWEGLRVLDIGCFHGYFCFKVLEAGAKNVVGIDKRSDVLATTRLIAEEIKAYNCDFFTLTANQLGDFAKDKYDVVLVMNVFHHIADQDAFFNSFHSEQPFIMEIDKEDLTKVQKHCIIIQEKPSHRASFHTGDTPNRLVILAEKR
jgi:SAM-dependent methyltransferase